MKDGNPDGNHLLCHLSKQDETKLEPRLPTKAAMYIEFKARTPHFSFMFHIMFIPKHNEQEL